MSNVVNSQAVTPDEVIYDGKRATVFEAGRRIEMMEQPGGDYGVAL